MGTGPPLPGWLETVLCAQYGGLVPSYRNMFVRGQLLEQLGRGDVGPTLICAPSGHGKTVLAAQLAQCFDGARWIDCQGEPPDQDLLADEIAILLGKDRSPDSSSKLDLSRLVVAGSSQGDGIKRCLVLDDVLVAGAPRVIEMLWLTANLLSQSDCSLVVTSTDAIDRPCSTLRHFALVGPDDLRFTNDEARSIAEANCDVSVETAAQVWEETQGHAAFFAVMLQACKSGSSPSLKHPRLSAWIDHVVSTQLSDGEYRLLQVASLLGSGRTTDLGACRIEHAAAVLKRASTAMPLLRMVDSRSASSPRTGSFVVHDLLVEYVLSAMRRGESSMELAGLAVSVLVDRADFVRVARIVDLAGQDKVIDFLLRQGFACERAGGASRLTELFSLAPLTDIMAEPRLLLLWADVLLDCDEFSESLSKARAARVLAEHDGDMSTVVEAIATALDALRLMNRWEEASRLLEEGRRLAQQSDVPAPARATMSRAGANMMILAGEFVEAERLLRQALEVESLDSRFVSDLRESSETLALIPCFARGDMMGTVRALSPWAALDEGRLSQRVDSRGNLAAALVEVGRIERAIALLREILPIAGTASLICYRPVLGCAQIADNNDAAGLESIAEGIALALEVRSELEAAQNRVFEAMVLRAAGEIDASLTAAERAYERLFVQDCMEFRRLAALEVAASLLAMGDPAAARAWAEPIVERGFGANAHHAFRAAMILSECDRLDGDVESGIRRLEQHSQHIVSENSNFQAAMYSRAFPNVLGMMSAAVGASSLPVHMLRMLPAEAAERVLRACRTYVDSGDWAVLGARLLGAEQFDAFIARKGRPICRVKVFGGLDITVGERTVVERDWRKRKARTLFAILVMNRGQEIPREQLLDHVWPDLPEDRARNNFYVAWSTMKGALMGADAKAGPCPYVENTAGRCRIATKSVRSDVDEFEELLAAGRDAEAAGDAERAIEAYERLSTVYRGELLPGDVYDDWFSTLRDRYRFEFLAAMLRLVGLLLERDDPCNALVFARRALHIDPYREDLYQSTLRCQIAAGQRSAAVETFVQCKTQLAEELGLDPSAETMALYQQVLVMEERPRYDPFGASVDGPAQN